MRQSSQIFACIRTRWLGFNGVISTKPSAFLAFSNTPGTVSQSERAVLACTRPVMHVQRSRRTVAEKADIGIAMGGVGMVVIIVKLVSDIRNG